MGIKQQPNILQMLRDSIKREARLKQTLTKVLDAWSSSSEISDKNYLIYLEGRVQADMEQKI